MNPMDDRCDDNFPDTMHPMDTKCFAAASGRRSSRADNDTQNPMDAECADDLATQNPMDANCERPYGDASGDFKEGLEDVIILLQKITGSR